MKKHENSVRLGPYIGITGFTSGDQVDALLPLLPASPAEPHPGRSLMVGVLASDKTLAGEPVRRPLRCPKPSDVSSIFRDGCFNVLHFHTEDSDRDLLDVAYKCGLTSGCGMQLNIAWPNPARVEALIATGIRVILQLGAGAVRGMPRKDLEERLAEYRKIDYVLVDMSGGRGVRLEPSESIELLELVRSVQAAAGPVVAGGLGPDSADLLLPLFAGFRGYARRMLLGCDAEGGLRNPDDSLSLKKCVDYVARVHELFSSPLAPASGASTPA